ncbi:MAG: hypothetical protein IPP71_18285 [Bacteroidetes bacterium]|nr:hypothetical protein [Bacteroidota bacterium]
MNDLHQIKLMGFNMVRPDFTAEWDTDVNQFYLKGRTYGIQTTRQIRITIPVKKGEFGLINHHWQQTLISLSIYII